MSIGRTSPSNQEGLFLPQYSLTTPQPHPPTTPLGFYLLNAQPRLSTPT